MGQGLFDVGPPDVDDRSGAVDGGDDSPDAPLAVRMRPRTIDEVVGQGHLLGPGSPLRRLVEGSAPLSLILWGPPGTGKTTLARLVAGVPGRRFVQLSALTAGVKDVRAVIETAKTDLARRGTLTVLFIDEIHRFSKTQQDSLLGAVEARTVPRSSPPPRRTRSSRWSHRCSRAACCSPSNHSPTTTSAAWSTAP